MTDRPDHDLICPKCKGKDSSPIPEGPPCSSGCDVKMEWDVVDYGCSRWPIRPFVRRLVEQADRGMPVQLNQYRALSMNSFEREFLMPSLSDGALLWQCENTLANCEAMLDSNRPAVTYDESAIHRLLPELMRRLAKSHE